MSEGRAIESQGDSAMVAEIKRILLDGCNLLPPNPEVPEGSCNEEMANAYGCDPPYGECPLRRIWDVIGEKRNG